MTIRDHTAATIFAAFISGRVASGRTPDRGYMRIDAMRAYDAADLLIEASKTLDGIPESAAEVLAAWRAAALEEARQEVIAEGWTPPEVKQEDAA